jgi:small-conductance mechanosensitive channel
VLEKVVTYGLVVIGAVAGLSTAGLNLSSFSLFAGAFGIGVGLGLQGVVKEFVSGLFLIFDPSLSVGDYVEVEDGARGVIVEIGTRSTRLRTNDNINILIPNSHLIDRPVINTTLHGDTRRIHIPFKVAPGADRALVRETVLNSVRDSPFTLPESPARLSQVWLVGYSEESMEFELLVWPTKEAVKRPASMQAAYLCCIVDALETAGISLPTSKLSVRLQPGEAAPAAPAAAEVPPARPRSVNDAAHDVMAPEDPEVARARAQASRPPPAADPAAPPPS